MLKRVLSILVAVMLLLSMTQAVLAVPSEDSPSFENLEKLHKWENIFTSLSLDSSEYTLNIGETHATTVTAAFKNKIPVNVTYFSEYESSNVNVATVSAEGVVKPISTGTAVITASFFGKTATAQITVKDAWIMVWNDEFDGTAVDPDKWGFENNGGGFGNHELQYYRPENATVEGGKLVIEARKEPYLGSEYTSSKMWTRDRADWTYGKFEIRAKMPVGKGIWPAIWMMPTDGQVYEGWPTCGEIDIMEYLGHDPATVYGTLHYGSPHDSTGASYTLPDGQKFNDDYHTFAIEWEPGEMRWYVDGQLYSTKNGWYSKSPNEGADYTYPAPFDRDFYMQLNLAVGGDWPGAPDGTTAFPQRMYVDYVRVYELTGRPYREPGTPPPPKEVSGQPARDPLADGNLIYNSSFDQAVVEGQENIPGMDNSAYWIFVHSSDFGGDGTAVNDNGSAKMTVTNPGGPTYSVQLIQRPVNLVTGHNYKVSFDAKASTARSMDVKMSSGGFGGWADYAARTIALATEMKHYSFDFQMMSAPNTQARIEFNMGAGGINTVWVDNVRVEEVPVDPNAPRAPLASGNLIYNGTFDQGAERMGFWQSAITGGAAASLSVGSDIPDRLLRAEINDIQYGTVPEEIRVYQSGFTLEKDKSYTLSFDARASEARSITAAVGDSTQTFAITNTMKTYSFTFTRGSDTDNAAPLSFYLGGDPNDVYLDNVRIMKYVPQAPVPTNGELLTNGGFDYETQGWITWAGGGGVAQMGAENGELKAAVSAEGTDYWSIQLVQNNLTAEKDKTYVLKFDARSSVPRDIQAMVERNGGEYTKYSGMLTASLTNTMKTFTYEFTMGYPTDSAAHLVLALGKIGAGFGPSDVYIDNVSLMEKVIPPANNLLTNGTFEEDTGGWGTWFADWENARSEISVVNGMLKTAITYEGIESWATQVFQNNLPIEKGQAYTLTFSAAASIPRNITVLVEKNGDPYTKYMDLQTVALTGSMKTFTFDFTMASDNDPAAHLVFSLGGTNVGAPHDIYLDNISLVKKGGTTLPPPDEGHALLNGTFDTDTASWKTYTGDGSNAVLSMEDGKAKIDFTAYDGWFRWSTQVYQDKLKLESGKTYTVSFDTYSTAAKDVQVEILSGGTGFKYLDTQTLSLTADKKTFSYTFTISGETDQNAKLAFLLGSNNVPGESFVPHSIFIDNVSLSEKTP
jgi:beta-glucanase (GH16 family)